MSELLLVAASKEAVNSEEADGYTYAGFSNNIQNPFKMVYFLSKIIDEEEMSIHALVHENYVVFSYKQVKRLLSNINDRKNVLYGFMVNNSIKSRCVEKLKNNFPFSDFLDEEKEFICYIIMSMIKIYYLPEENKFEDHVFARMDYIINQSTVPIYL